MNLESDSKIIKTNSSDSKETESKSDKIFPQTERKEKLTDPYLQSFPLGIRASSPNNVD